MTTIVARFTIKESYGFAGEQYYEAYCPYCGDKCQSALGLGNGAGTLEFANAYVHYEYISHLIRKSYIFNG